MPPLSALLCQVSTGRCIECAAPDGLGQGKGQCGSAQAHVRVGPYASDRSYGQYFFGGGAPNNGHEAAFTSGNLSMAFTAGKGGLRLLASPVGCGGGAAATNCSDFELRLNGRFLWTRVGRAGVASDLSAIGFAPAGDLAPARAAVLGDGGRSVVGGNLTINLGAGAVGVSTFAGDDLAAVRAAVGAARDKHSASMRDAYGTDALAEVATAVEAAAMWTLVSTPAENAHAVLMPVSRAWQRAENPVSRDYTYAIFDWDNLFASLLAGMAPAGRDAAYSNVIQSFKAKTAEGYLANCAGGGYKDQDRTEPPVGAKVLLALWQKWGDAWLVELLFDDALDWGDWFVRTRVLPPAGLIALRSYNELHGEPGCGMQCARYESGLDNSPMYDCGNATTCEYFDAATGTMQLYDVGMSSMVTQEAFALAELASAIGRPEAAALRARGEHFRELIRTQLWDERQGIFANRFANGTFSDRISPTSFYALLAGAATDAQAGAMVSGWLTNRTRFCVSPAGDFAGNDDSCWWGLPSIAADDDAFPPLGYWRGFVWGPMAQLTHWSLQNYDHVPSVRAARKGLARQMSAMFVDEWRRYAHVCENYNPHRNASVVVAGKTWSDDCTGTRFYHWGALAGLIEVVEQGKF